MASKIINKATLEYKSGDASKSAVSNTTSVDFHGPLEIVIHTLENHYQLNDELTYQIFVTNTGTKSVNNVKVYDNLSTYEFTTAYFVTPLTYVGPAKHFKSDTTATELTADTSSADKVIFTIATLAAGDTALIEYKVKTNEYAPTSTGSKLNTIAKVEATDISAVTNTYELPIGSYADLLIEKSMSPDPVVDGNPLTYTFLLQNYGTLDATYTVLKDTFTPVPQNITVTIEGTQIEPDFYSIDADGKFLYPSALQTSANFIIPAATYVQDKETGVVTCTPGSRKVVIVGII